MIVIGVIVGLATFGPWGAVAGGIVGALVQAFIDSRRSA